MAEKVYANPPIREAIFDLRFKFENLPTQDQLEEAYKKISGSYPKKETTFERTLSFEVQGEGEPKIDTSGGPNGIKLISGDGLQIVQFRTNGFTFSRLKPYTKWESFSTEALRLLEIYSGIAKPLYVERFALRYVNVIEVPETYVNISEYFVTEPKVGDAISQKLANFFLRLMIQDSDSSSIAIINQTLQPSEKKDFTNFLFDVDVFQENLKVELGSTEFTEILSQLKAFRTGIFQGSLTDKAKALFD